MKKYKNIVFDIGDVLLSYRWRDMLINDYGMEEKDALAFGESIFTDPIWKDMDRGLLSIDGMKKRFIDEKRKHADAFCYLLDHAEEMSIKTPDIWERVKKLKEKGYKLYLLSNYCHELLKRHLNGATFLEDVDGKIISSDYGVIKPEQEIYEILLNTFNLNPSESIFFDDREDNIEAAKKMGLDGFVVNDMDKFRDTLDILLSL